MIDKGSSVDAIYLDFAMAFDSVPQEQLLEKVESLGIEGNTPMFKIFLHWQTSKSQCKWISVRLGCCKKQHTSEQCSQYCLIHGLH